MTAHEIENRVSTKEGDKREKYESGEKRCSRRISITVQEKFFGAHMIEERGGREIEMMRIRERESKIIGSGYDFSPPRA